MWATYSVASLVNIAICLMLSENVIHHVQLDVVGQGKDKGRAVSNDEGCMPYVFCMASGPRLGKSLIGSLNPWPAPSPYNPYGPLGL